MKHELADFIIDSDERAGEGGFLALRRLRMRNRRTDGSASAPYVCDAVVRPYGQDAVVVAVYTRTARGIEVLLRECMRPVLPLVRDPARAPMPEPRYGMFLTELVAGIVEEGDHGEHGLRLRAAAEVREEAGFVVEPGAITLLGAGMLPSPGCLAEKYYFTAALVDPSTQQALEGDGSPMEEGATTRWMLMPDVLAACTRGDITDLKTELGVRRLRDHLAAP